MENPILVFFYLILIAWSIFTIILTFRIWGLCNDVRKLRKHFIKETPTPRKDTDTPRPQQKTETTNYRIPSSPNGL